MKRFLFLAAALAAFSFASLDAEARPRAPRAPACDPTEFFSPCAFMTAPQVERRPAAGRVWRETYQRRQASVIGGRPSGCPSRFCGCGASLEIFGKIIPRLNLARNWFGFPRSAPGFNKVAVRRGHVFVLKRPTSDPRKWLVLDYNSGGGKTRLHERSIAGYVIVDPQA